MQISINDVANGIGLLVDGQIYFVADYNHVKPGKGAAFVRIRLKNVKTDAVLERTFRSAESLEQLDLENRKCQFLYASGEFYYFMDQTTFEEREVSREMLGNGVNYLQDNLEVVAVVNNEKIVRIDIPNFIVAQIVECEPGIRGDSSKLGTKPAKIDTGATIQVPLFIEVGEVIKVDTRSGIYVERVKK